MVFRSKSFLAFFLFAFLAMSSVSQAGLLGRYRAARCRGEMPVARAALRVVAMPARVVRLVRARRCERISNRVHRGVPQRACSAPVQAPSPAAPAAPSGCATCPR